MIFRGPACDGVNDTEHVPLFSVQESGVNDPEDALNDTVPAGDDPVTWAVTVVVLVTGIDGGVSVTDSVEVDLVMIVTTPIWLVLVIPRLSVLCT